MSIQNFSQLALSQPLQQAVADMGFTIPSPIQAAAIPLLLSGKDVTGQAQTGTGKTASFGIPMIEQAPAKGLSSIVICPTRELAQQVAGELQKLAKHRREIRIVAIYGGAPIGKQIAAVKAGANVIVGTPGRLKDLLQRNIFSLSQIRMAVLDEADEMLNMGFRRDIETLLGMMPATRQTVLFSATMPKAILDIASRHQRHPEFVRIAAQNLTAPAIQQSYYEVKAELKISTMTNLMDEHQLKLMIVFCNTKRKTDALAKRLKAEGRSAAAIHGNLSQNQRNAVLDSFRKGRISILVATDVAARGLDIDNVDSVFNFDLPMEPEFYVHRIGRTARAGKSGKAFSLVTGSDEMRRLRSIEKHTKATIEKKSGPVAVGGARR